MKELIAIYMIFGLLPLLTYSYDRHNLGDSYNLVFTNSSVANIIYEVYLLYCHSFKYRSISTSFMLVFQILTMYQR